MKPKRLVIDPDGWKEPENTVRVDTGKWANPFKIGAATGCKSHEDTVDMYRRYLDGQIFLGGREVYHRAGIELKGKNLACSCPSTSQCHANVLLIAANTDRLMRKFDDDAIEKERRREVAKSVRHITMPSGYKAPPPPKVNP